jgi:hypothetical protein
VNLLLLIRTSAVIKLLSTPLAQGQGLYREVMANLLISLAFSAVERKLVRKVPALNAHIFAVRKSLSLTE